MSNWDPIGENSVPDEYRATLSEEYEQSETEVEPPQGPGACWIVALALVFWLCIGVYMIIR